MGFNFLIPIGICVVLPVMIVWLVMRSRQHDMDKKTEVMLKAIEAGAKIDADFFRGHQEALTIKERLLKRLTSACVTSLLGLFMVVGGVLFGEGMGWDILDGPGFILAVPGGVLLAIGIALFIVYFVGKKMLAKEIEAEERSIK